MDAIRSVLRRLENAGSVVGKVVKDGRHEEETGAVPRLCPVRTAADSGQRIVPTSRAGSFRQMAFDAVKSLDGWPVVIAGQPSCPICKMPFCGGGMYHPDMPCFSPLICYRCWKRCHEEG